MQGNGLTNRAGLAMMTVFSITNPHIITLPSHYRHGGKIMRWEILKLLRAKSPAYLSGEEMATHFQVSRTAIWKNIQSLQAGGYHIEGSTRLGYRLLKSPDFLYPAEIVPGSATKVIAVSLQQIHHYLQVDSTNNVLKEMAGKGAPEGTVTVAEEQTGGRGRLGRTWLSPAGKGIWFSILFRPSLAPQKAPLFTLLAASAVVQAIKTNLPALDPGIKWPNDLLLNGRKVCGILTEMKAEADLLHYLVTGIGLNVNCREEDFSPELQGSATSLYLENSKKIVPRQKLARDILREIDHHYRVFLEGGATRIITSWKKNNITLGRKVVVRTLQGAFQGQAVDLDSDGALLVEDDQGKINRFLAGEITLQA
jgi:BirA family biotin operon repressor/biotin-[acetyl-CoA-carboxylase] ligase